MIGKSQQRFFVTGAQVISGLTPRLIFYVRGMKSRFLTISPILSPDMIARLTDLAGRAPTMIEGDIQDQAALTDALRAQKYDAVLHFAGLKSVAESVDESELYDAVNVGGTKKLLAAMREGEVNAIVFSSSATVYGNNGVSPIAEDTPLNPVNPYGQTKADCEVLLQGECANNPTFAAAILRYFNPVGADKSAKIGELPTGVPANLMPIILQAATGERDQITIYGDDYDTIDGTGVRDFIHVSDLAAGHSAALPYIMERPGAHVINLGTGRGYSVVEMIKTFEAVNGVAVPYSVGPRRPGDLGEVVANPDFARHVLGWNAALGLEDMCRDAWAWKKTIAKSSAGT